MCNKNTNLLLKVNNYVECSELERQCHTVPYLLWWLRWWQNRRLRQISTEFQLCVEQIGWYSLSGSWSLLPIYCIFVSKCLLRLEVNVSLLFHTRIPGHQRRQLQPVGMWRCIRWGIGSLHSVFSWLSKQTLDGTFCWLAICQLLHGISNQSELSILRLYPIAGDLGIWVWDPLGRIEWVWRDPFEDWQLKLQQSLANPILVFWLRWMESLYHDRIELIGAWMSCLIWHKQKLWFAGVLQFIVQGIQWEQVVTDMKMSHSCSL